MGTVASVPDAKLSLNEQLIYLNDPRVAGALLLKAFKNETRACAFALTVNEYMRQCIAQTVESPKSQVIADLYAALHGAYKEEGVARDIYVETLQNLFLIDAKWKDFCPTALPDSQKSPWRVFLLPGDATAAYAVLPLWSALCCVVRGETACLLLKNEVCAPPTAAKAEEAEEAADLTGGMPRTSASRKGPKARESADAKKTKALVNETSRQQSERQTKVATARKGAAAVSCRVSSLTQPVNTDKINEKKVQKVKRASQGKQNVPILPQGYVQAVNWESAALTKEDERLTKNALQRVSGGGVNALKVVEELVKKTPPEQMRGSVWSFLMKHKLKIGFGVVLVGFAFMLHTMVVGAGSGIASAAAQHAIDEHMESQPLIVQAAQKFVQLVPSSAPLVNNAISLFNRESVVVSPQEFADFLNTPPSMDIDGQSFALGGGGAAAAAFYGVSYSYGNV